MRLLLFILFLAIGQISSAQVPPVVVKPQPPVNVNEFVSKNLQYPQMARDAGVSGRVFVRFMVDEYGKISDIQAVKRIGSGCDEEAMRVVKAMPDWKPGSYNGKPSRMYFVLPVKFRLQ